MARPKKSLFKQLRIPIILFGIYFACRFIEVYPKLFVRVFLPFLIAIAFIIISYFGLKWNLKARRKRKILNSGINKIDEMQGIDFERYLAILFERLGYKAKTTPASGDFGADLVLQKDGQTIVVQAKRYNKPVGLEAVQQVHSSISYYKANEAWVISNQDFMNAAIELARKNKVRLINRNELIDLITEVQESQKSTG